jgi:hypothetical protein
MEILGVIRIGLTRGNLSDTVNHMAEAYAHHLMVNSATNMGIFSLDSGHASSIIDV